MKNMSSAIKAVVHWMKSSRSTKLLVILSLPLVVFYVASCKKDKENLQEHLRQNPLYLGGGVSQAASMSLSYDVVIQRSTSFKKELTDDSPAWKRVQAVPETESYSFQASVNDGGFYLLQDHITLHSVLRDRLPVEERIAKIEITSEVSTAYDANGNIINSQPVGDLSQGFLDGISSQYYNSPINTAILGTSGVNYKVDGDKVTIVTSIANGDANNSVSTFNLNTGAPLLVMNYDDNDWTKITFMVAHGYDNTGKLQSSVFTYYDYLDDGDVKSKTERWSYSNFSLNFL